MGGGALLLGLWLGLDMRLGDTRVIFLPWLLAASLLAASAGALCRWWGRRERFGTASPERAAEPYLQRLFAGRVEAGAKKGVKTVAARAIQLADCELGKTLQSWEGGLVRWAKQKSLDRRCLPGCKRRRWLQASRFPASASAIRRARPPCRRRRLRGDLSPDRTGRRDALARSTGPA